MANVSPAFGSLVPSQKQTVLSSNYLNFTDGSGNDFAQQYLPEIYEQEVERYGNRTLSGFLRMVGAEMPMTSDQVVWSEQNRLHISYTNVTVATNTTLTIAQSASVQCVISQNQTIVVMNPANGQELKCLVTGVSGAGSSGTATLTVLPYTQVNLYGATVDFTGLTTAKIFVYGSEFAKGTTDATITNLLSLKSAMKLVDLIWLKLVGLKLLLKKVLLDIFGI
jgi:hypothetical protein